MMDDVDPCAGGSASTQKRLGESGSSTSSKRQRTIAIPSLEQEEEGGSHLEGSDMAKGAGSLEMSGYESLNDKEFSSLYDLSSMEKGVMTNPESESLRGGDESSSLPLGDHQDTAPSTSGAKDSNYSMTSPRINNYIKQELMKEVRRFGRKYQRIFILLDEVHGPLEVKKNFVKFTINEAARFKRRDLIQRLEKLLESMF